MTWADSFNTYEEACVYYGADTPDMLRHEAQAEWQEWQIEVQDDLEISGPKFKAWKYSEEIPF